MSHDIRHLGGQIEDRSRSTWKSINFHPNIPIINFEMKSGIQGVRSSVGSDQCAKIFVWNPLPAVQSSVWQRHSWHGLLLVAPHLNKGNHGVVVMIRALHLDRLEVPDQGVLMNFLAHLQFSKESSTTCCYLPPLLSETRDYFFHCFTHLHRVFWIVVTPRQDWEDWKLCSFGVTSLHLKYI